MKKIFGGVLLASLFGFTLLVNAADSDGVVKSGNAFANATLVSIDSLAIMQKSKEGSKVAAKITKEIETFQNEVKVAQQELVDAQSAVEKQAKVLSADALQAKNEELVQKKKDIERKLGDKEEALRLSIQKQQVALREKQMSVVQQLSESKKWDVVIDKNTPGVLCVSNAVDKTKEVLDAVDAKYDAAQLKSVGNIKKDDTKLAKGTASNSEKKTIKVA